MSHVENHDGNREIGLEAITVILVRENGNDQSCQGSMGMVRFAIYVRSDERDKLILPFITLYCLGIIDHDSGNLKEMVWG